uniref:Uncharacterized protein n=1 Tax=Ectopseudomonas oleovorans TaxID=301 RepID=A0A653B9R5_ECTOL
MISGSGQATYRNHSTVTNSQRTGRSRSAPGATQTFPFTTRQSVSITFQNNLDHFAQSTRKQFKPLILLIFLILALALLTLHHLPAT